MCIQQGAEVHGWYKRKSFMSRSRKLSIKKSPYNSDSNGLSSSKAKNGRRFVGNKGHGHISHFKM